MSTFRSALVIAVLAGFSFTGFACTGPQVKKDDDSREKLQKRSDKAHRDMDREVEEDE